MGALQHLAPILILGSSPWCCSVGRGKVSDLMGDFGRGINSFKKGLSRSRQGRAQSDQCRDARDSEHQQGHHRPLRRASSMFDLFSWSHILILLTVALVVVGPKDLPRLMNMAGKSMGKARNMANEFKKSFDDMARQSEFDRVARRDRKAQGRHPIAERPRFDHEIQRTLNPVETAAADARAAEPAQKTRPGPGAANTKSPKAPRRRRPSPETAQAVASAP